jgi:predicted nucleic acid-binding Zn ribbon protein
MNTLLDHFRCPICGGPIQGRSDKRYCSQKCKNTHHYLARRNCKPLIVEKNKRLERNFVILEGLIQQWHPVLKIHKSELGSIPNIGDKELNIKN